MRIGTKNSHRIILVGVLLLSPMATAVDSRGYGYVEKMPAANLLPARDIPSDAASSAKRSSIDQDSIARIVLLQTEHPTLQQNTAALPTGNPVYMVVEYDDATVLMQLSEGADPQTAAPTEWVVEQIVELSPTNRDRIRDIVASLGQPGQQGASDARSALSGLANSHSTQFTVDESTVSELQPLFVSDASAVVAATPSIAIEPAYVDQLIDPNAPVDLPITQTYSLKGIVLGRRSLQIETRARTHNRISGGPNHDQQGLSIRYAQETTHYGTLGLDASGQRGDGDSSQRGNNEEGKTHYNGAVVGFQYAFPITRHLLMDNRAGMHRIAPSFVGVIGTRGRLQYPAILGLSTRIYNGDGHELRVAAGEIGEYRSQIVRAFDSTSGHAARLAYEWAIDDAWTTGAELWNVSDRDIQAENRTGGGIGAQYQDPNDNNEINLRLLADNAAHFGFSIEATNASARIGQAYGAYYYEADLRWLSELSQNNRYGAYYQVNHNGGRLRSNLSLEWNRSGFDRTSENSAASPEEDTYLVAAGLHYRSGASQSASINGSYRRSTQRGATAINASGTNYLQDYRLRAAYSFQHGNTMSSILDVAHSRSGYNSDVKGSTQTEWLYSLDWRAAAHRMSVELGYSQQRGDGGHANSPVAGATWTYLASNGGQVAAGARYRYENTRQQDRYDWSAYFDAAWPISNNWLAGVEGQYNDYHVINDDSDQGETDSSSVLVYLRYELNAGEAIRPLGTNKTGGGGGEVTGVVYHDRNRDGIRQASEPGVAGVEVYLDRRHLAVTDKQGEFNYALVTPGSHHLYVAEETLPLPYTINSNQMLPIEVQLRGSARTELAVTEIVD